MSVGVGGGGGLIQKLISSSLCTKVMIVLCSVHAQKNSSFLQKWNQ